jgi:hypothetical protein
VQSSCPSTIQVFNMPLAALKRSINDGGTANARARTPSDEGNFRPGASRMGAKRQPEAP